MTINCAVCNCPTSFANSPESFQAAVLTVLCQLLEASQFINVTPQIMCTTQGVPVILLITVGSAAVGVTVTTQVYSLSGEVLDIDPDDLVSCCCDEQPK